LSRRARAANGTSARVGTDEISPHLDGHVKQIKEEHHNEKTAG
jgi:hypothetical protein